MPIDSRIMFDSVNSSASHRKNAAEERSPGTVASIAFSRCPPGMLKVSPVRSNVAPNARNACSEWSRVRTDSDREVTPPACNPAKSTAVFTCAEGIGVSKLIACSGPPWMVMGAWPSTRSIFAPIAESGLRMRSIGRSVRE